MNQVLLIGRLTRDPELRFIPNSGTAVARFSMAVNREFKKEGQPEADFFNIVVWGKSAENCANYLRKGRLVAINGRMQNNNYEDKNGVKHYNVEVVANRVEFLEFGDKNEGTKAAQQGNQQIARNNYSGLDNHNLDGFQSVDITDSDIPF